MLKLNKHIGVKAEAQQREFIKQWKSTIRWRNGYTYRNIKVKFKGLKAEVSVNVPWAKTMDDKYGTFKDGSTLAAKMKADWEAK